MNVKKVCLIGATLLILFQSQVVNAYEEKEITEYSNGIVKIIEGTTSEENKILEDYTKDIEINGKIYKTSSVERKKLAENTKIETVQKTEILNTNNEEKIKEHFGNTYIFEDEEFKGELPITNIQTSEINQGSYQEIEEKRINFNGYSQNDLNEIDKEIVLENKNFYLINVEWKPEKVEVIDNQEVPISYQGTMVYQTVVTKKNPSKYEVALTYSGEVLKKDTTYEYSIFYTPVEEIIEEEKETNIVPIVISGLGIGVIAFLYLLSIGNIKVYNKTDQGNKLIGKFKITNKNKVIDITKYQYKTKSNIYCLKLNNNLYKKIKNQTIYLQIDKIKKSINVNAQYIEIII